MFILHPSSLLLHPIFSSVKTFSSGKTESRASSALRPIVTFLNHGILPCVGREREIERILGFWRETTSEPALRALLLTAEAGMGKSRLAEEIIGHIERDGGAVVHLRFYPDSSLSLAPVLSQAVRLAAARQQLPTTSEGSSSVALLRRLSYLRPTMLVLEDVHLLHGNPLRELQQMLNAVGDLPLSLLILTRPVELAVRGVIEPWLVSEIQLQGLDEPAVARLLSVLFTLPATGWIAPALHTATLGNPLAIRAALRAAVTVGTLVDGSDGSWRISVSESAFTASLARGVNLLTEGMVAHLDPEERRGAEQLAELGEVFAPETARALYPDADRVIESLQFRGVISPLLLPISPLVGQYDGSRLLVFSHTLLHRNLMGAGGLAPDRVIAALAAGVPFFSAHAVEELARRPGEESDHEVTFTALKRLLDDASRLDATNDWQFSSALFDAATALAALLLPGLDSDGAQELEARLLHCRIALMRRQIESDEHATLLDRVLTITAGASEGPMLEYRMAALRKRHHARLRAGTLTVEGSWEEMDAFIAPFPELRFGREYIIYLREFAQWAMFAANSPMMRVVERRLGEIEESGRLDESLQRLAHREILLNLVTHFESPAEMEQRLRFLAEIEADPDGNPGRIAVQKIMLLSATGWSDRLKAVLDEWIQRFDVMGNWRNVFQFRLLAISERAVFGEDLESLSNQLKEFIASAPECDREKFDSTAFTTMTAAAMLRGEPETAVQFQREFGGSLNRIEYAFNLMLALVAAETEEIDRLLAPEVEERCATSLLARLSLAVRPPALEEVIEQTRLELRRPLLFTRDLLVVHQILTLIQQLDDAGGHTLGETLAPEIRSAIEQALEWLQEREAFAYMLPIVGRYRRWLTRRQADAWIAKANRIAQQRRARQDGLLEQDRLRIRMLDTIEARHPGGEVIPVRGGRLRLLLGLLVADRMLARPLSHREFCRIASGDEDPERARKTMNGAVMRLREAIGADAITTDEETPRLNIPMVGVDLLEALDACRQARDAVHGRLLSHALARVRQALDIWGGNVPFPTLYESLFEAAREDFEIEIRSTMLTVVNALLAEGDPVGAEDLLRRASAIMPDDQQITELLIATLESSGQKFEAERIRRVKSEG